MRKKIGAILVICVLLLFIAIRTLSHSDEREEVKQAGGQAQRITKAAVAKMVSMLAYDKEEIMDMEWEIIYQDVEKEEWYAPYINAFYSMGITETDTSDSNFEPESFLCYEEAEHIIKQWVIAFCREHKSQDSTTLYNNLMRKAKESIENENPSSYIKKSHWDTLYQIINQDWYGGKVKEEMVYVLQAQTKEGTDTVITDKGNYGIAGIEAKDIEGKPIHVFVKDNEVAGLLEISTQPYTLQNVYLTGADREHIQFVMENCALEYACDSYGDKLAKGTIADLTVKDSYVESVCCHDAITTEQVADFTKEKLILADGTALTWPKTAKVYQVGESVECFDTSVLQKQRELILVKNSRGDICGALIDTGGKRNTIRVLITTNSFEYKYHDSITFTSDRAFKLCWKNGSKSYEAGRKCTIKKSSKKLKDGEIEIIPAKDSKIKLCSIKRNGVHPLYRGNMTVTKEDEGLVLVNELSIEEYLYAVLPSEMPKNYGKEALKAQAVCARSYAYQHLSEEGYDGLGADLDDSTSYQVYNNIPENEDTIEAVDETKGQVLLCEGEVISTYYYSTSCGHSATADEVWSGAKKQKYLVGDFLAVKENGKKHLEQYDLTKDDDFRKFLKSKVPTYDSDAAWYRWNVKMQAKQIKNNLDMHLEERYYANPELILTKDEKGEYKSIPVGTVGEVKEIRPLTRAAGGIITELLIVGSKATIKIYTEYNIRRLLAPSMRNVVRKDKSRVYGLGMLPSAFFVVDKLTDKKGKTVFTFQGGGYGHGVGMSQTAAAAMAEMGYSYEKILALFYQGSEIGYP